MRRMLLLSLSFIALFVASATAASAKPCANANTPADAAPKQAIKAAVVCLLNQQRAEHGLPPLKEDARLDRSAQGWTDTEVRDDDYSHGADFSARITAAGFKWSAAGENIASGFPTPRSVVDAWMGSTGHCQNILAPNFSAVGTGFVADVHAYGTDFTTWTNDFALPMGAAWPSRNSGPADGCPYTVS